MTNSTDFVRRVEQDILRTRAIDKSTCETFANLPVECRIGYVGAMMFLGCDTEAALSENAATTLVADRIMASRLMLLKLQLDTGDPRWSSSVLDRLLETVVKTPSGSVGDLFHALYEVLGEYSCDLSEPVANFIKDIVVGCFTRHRASYDATTLSWMVDKIIEGPSPAQACFALHAIPPNIMRPKCAVSILRRLEATPYWKEAVNTIGEDLDNEEARALLAQWLAEGVDPSCASDIERILT